MKKVFAALLALCLILSMTACDFHFTKTVSNTTTDANGNTTTVTTTSTNNNGNVSESSETVTSSAEPITCAKAAEDGEIHTLPFSLTNETGRTYDRVYIMISGSNLEDAKDLTGEDSFIPDTFIDGTLRYDKDHISFDFYLYVDGVDEPDSFSGVDMSNIRADIDQLALAIVEKEGNLRLVSK